MKEFFGDSVERFIASHPFMSSFGSNKNKFGSMGSGPSSDNNECDLNTQIVQYILILIAVYLAMKCKKNGNLSVAQIVLAILFAPIYILYRLIKPCM